MQEPRRASRTSAFPLNLQLEKLEAKFGRSLSSEGTAPPGKVCSSLLSGWVLQALKECSQLSGVLVFATSFASLLAGGEGVSQGPCGAKASVGSAGKEG